jgi:glycerophosphoryl diester phosphodiesterase
LLLIEVLAILVAAGGVPQIVAHRGLSSAAAPENTIAAFRAAWAEGADAIENDWRLTRDGRVVCLHDEVVDRTTTGKGAVSTLLFDEVRALDAGLWKGEKWRGQKVPTLAEMLATVPPGKRAFIHVKVGPEIIPALKREILAAGTPPDRIAIIAFSEKVIAAAKREMPQIKAYWLLSFERIDNKWSPSDLEVLRRVQAMGADGLNVEFTYPTSAIVTRQLSQKLADAGLELLVWTIDDPNLARRAQSIGVRAITTNTPGPLRAVVHRR